MTLTVTPRRTAVLAIIAVAFATAYLLGAAHSGGSVAAAAGTGSPVATGAATTAASSTGGITVSGTGKVTGTPDTLRLDLTVVATGGSVTSALASANQTTTRVQKTVHGRGVATKDLQTSGLSIQPNYSYSGSGQPIPKGYQVSESLSVLLRDLASAGATINAAVDAGGNAMRVDGIGLDLADTSSLVSAARSSAFGEAKTKAEQYAAAAGRALGQVVSVSEVVGTPSPVYSTNTSAQAMAPGVPLPLQAGTQDVSVTVTVVFAFA